MYLAAGTVAAVKPRPSTPADLDKVLAVPATDPLAWITAQDYRDELDQHRYRPEWTWVVEDGGDLVARAVWWGGADDETPSTLDCLWVRPDLPDPAALGARLLNAAHAGFGARPRFLIKLSTGWRDDPASRAAVDWRSAAAAEAGLSHRVERLQFAWTPADPAPRPGDRLVFSPEPDNEAFVDVFRRTAAGSIDDETRKTVAAQGLDAAARSELRFYLNAPGGRDWWRLAHTPDGELAGFAIPSATPYGHNVGFLGVVPEQRGHGYVNDILAEITRSQIERGAERITATTDAANHPMAAAFKRAGFRNTETRLILSD